MKQTRGSTVNLFFKDERPLEQLLEGLGLNSPEFQFWARTTLRSGWLEKIVDILIRTGRVADKKEAVEYLEKLGSPAKSSDLKIAKGDFSGELSREPFRLLEEKLGYGRKDPNLYPHYGVVGHKAIGDLLSGKIPDYQKATETLKQGQKIRYRQGHIFKTKTAGQFQPALFSQGELYPQTSFIQEILPGNIISAQLENEIVELWKLMTALAASHPSANWIEFYNLFLPLMPKLEIRLWPIFQEHLANLKSDQAFSKYLKALTLMSLASLVPWFKNNRTHLFREIPVLANPAGVNGGQIDAIEILTINGHPPDKTEEELLKKMSENSYSSVGHLVGALRRAFGHHLQFRITDWKFMMGEGVEQGRIIRPSELETPLEQHALQVKSYAALANLDCYLQNEDGRNSWHDHPYFTKVRIVYILPLSSPIAHEFEVLPMQQKKIFQEEFVAKLHLAQKQAVLRNYNNLLVGHVTGMLGGKEKQLKQPNNSRKKTSLFPEIEVQNRLKRIIEKYRRFADEKKIIEIAKRNKEGDDLLLLHLDRLVKNHPDFNLETGGFISCLIHSEKTPSMRLDMARGFFKCFGCGVFGLIVSSQPTTTIRRTTLNGKASFEPSIKKIGKIVISKEHHRIIEMAQQILNQRFKNGLGLPYVVARGIDPDLAHLYGAGYGDNHLIESLLESYTLDELIHYGFVAVSDRVTPDHGLGPLLAQKGMSLSQMRRKMDTDQYKMGLPYSILEGRLTFPLMFEGRYTSFYGRAAWANCSNRSKHRKLSTKYTEVPHGLFNPQPIQAAASEVIVTEGVFDGLSLVQMGWINTTSIIGVGNYLNIEYLARSGKNIAIAFDHDSNKYQTGQTSTAKIIKYLQKIKYPGQICDFTKSFISQHPEFVHWGCKDFNEYLVRQQKMTVTA